MLDVVSCWRVDWTAIGAIATAGTCVIALGLARRDRVLRRQKEKKLQKAVAALMRTELQSLYIAEEKVRSLLDSWAMVDIRSMREEMMVELSPKLMIQTFQSMHDLSGEVLEAIGAVIAAAHQCHSIIPCLLDEDAREDEDLKKGVYEGIEYAASELRDRLLCLERVLNTDVRKRSVSNTPSDTPVAMLNK